MARPKTRVASSRRTPAAAPPAAPSAAAADERPAPWPRPAVRALLSVLVLVHLAAVLGRPLEFATQGPTGMSPAATLFYAPTRAYSEIAYLNHGYAFFAPNPGPSHLIRATLSYDSASPEGAPRERGTAESTADAPETRIYPDLRRQRPRLLYHRHFMLSEFLNNLYHPEEMPPEVVADPELAARWRGDRARYEAVWDSIVRHLQTSTGADLVVLERVQHRMPGLPEVLEERMRLDDPRLFQVLPERFSEPPPLEELPRMGR